MFDKITNRRGSVMILSVIVLIFLGGMLTAVSPMIINEVKFNSMNQNMVGAQFAAEAGAKVAIAAIDAKNANWDWLNNIQYLVSPPVSE